MGLAKLLLLSVLFVVLFPPKSDVLHVELGAEVTVDEKWAQWKPETVRSRVSHVYDCP